MFGTISLWMLLMLVVAAGGIGAFVNWRERRQPDESATRE